jgi:hypothetical protein
MPAQAGMARSDRNGKSIVALRQDYEGEINSARAGRRPARLGRRRGIRIASPVRAQ